GPGVGAGRPGPVNRNYCGFGGPGVAGGPGRAGFAGPAQPRIDRTPPTLTGPAPRHLATWWLPQGPPYTRSMGLQRGIDGSEPIGSEAAGQFEIRPSVARLGHLGTGTLACPDCDAPVALGGAVLR